MEHVSSRTPDDDRPDRSGRGALGWAVFLVLAVLVVAALFAGAIHGRLSRTGDQGVQPALSGSPSPSPTPLPRPGPAPRGTLFARIA